MVNSGMVELTQVLNRAANAFGQRSKNVGMQIGCKLPATELELKIDEVDVGRVFALQLLNATGNVVLELCGRRRKSVVDEIDI